MSKVKLEAAKEFIQEKNYDVAKVILETLPDDPTARRWLAKLYDIAPEVHAYDDPFANATPLKPLIPMPPPTRQQAQPPIQYEYKSVTVGVWFSYNLNKKVDEQINEMQRQGWEYVSQEIQPNAGAGGARILQFRRSRRR